MSISDGCLSGYVTLVICEMQIASPGFELGSSCPFPVMIAIAPPNVCMYVCI